jgi:predicted dehydrogenase
MTMNRSRSISRRHVLKSGLALGATAALPSWFAEELLAQAAPATPKGPNDMPGIALVGCGGRGRGILKEAAPFGRVVAVCDVDARRREETAIEHGDIDQTEDFRKLIARPDVDVVLNGTPDHWHTLVNLHAVKNGKDVYSEKPLTLTIDEGKRLRAAVREHKRVLQTGSQQRSDPQFRLVCELVRNGRLGKLSKVTTIVPAGLRQGPFKAAPVPQGLDWDMWLGQAPQVPYVKERTHANFRFWYDYSGGTITDWGAHHNDIARWGIGEVGPVSVDAKRLAEPIEGGYTAVPEYRIAYKYANGVTHTCQTTTADTIYGAERRPTEPGERRIGVLFEGPKGWIYVTRGKLEASDKALIDEPLPSGAERLYKSDNHMANFFECLRTRKSPAADVEIGHRSASICHLGSISLRLKRALKWDPAKEAFVGDDEAQGYVAREQRKPWTYEA